MITIIEKAALLVKALTYAVITVAVIVFIVTAITEASFCTHIAEEREEYSFQWGLLDGCQVVLSEHHSANARLFPFDTYEEAIR